MICNLSNTNDRVRPHIHANLEKGFQNTTRSGLLFSDFDVFENVVKHCLV